MYALMLLVIVLAVLPFFLLTVWALVDIATKQFPGDTREKAGWWLVATIPFVGWLIYILTGRRRGKKKYHPA
jgi:uncharacterized membrane protein